MRRKKILICFVGIDGSGKTSLAQSSVGILKERGLSAKFVWGAHELWVLKPLVRLGMMVFLRRSLKDAYNDYTDYYDSIKKASRRRFLAVTYQNLALLEYFLQIFLKVKIPLMLGKSIVCDRYIHDTMTQLAVNLGYTKEQFKSKLARLAQFCPVPDITFFVDIPEEVAYHRKNDIPSIEYLRLRREVYLSIVGTYRMIRLDGTTDLSELQKSVEKEIVKHFG